MTARTVVVVGAGAAGLSAGLLLARAGHTVTVVERDATPVPADAEAAGDWGRSGTPQTAHSHAFVARLRALLAEYAPDVLDGLLAAGVREVPLAVEPPPELTGPVADPTDELVVLASRRAVLEWVLRRAVEEQDGVTVVPGATVRGLLTDDAGPAPRVTGVVLEDGSSLHADLVVDAAGRGSPVPDLLTEAGAGLPAEKSVSCGITYYSRFYRLTDPTTLPGRLNRGYTAGSSYDRYSGLVFPADNGTFSVTFGVFPGDRELRGLHVEEAFEAAAAAVPALAPWVDPAVATPIGDVAAMAGLRNRVRRLVGDDGRPAALGVAVIGDAAVITNPAHTRGTTLAFLSAVLLAETLAEHGDDPPAFALALQAALDRELLPWFTDSVAQDAVRVARWDPAEPTAPPTPDGTVSNGECYTAGLRDPLVWAAFTRLQNVLALPGDVLADPAVVAATRAVLDSGWRPDPLPGPDHAMLAALVADAQPARPSPRAPREPVPAAAG